LVVVVVVGCNGDETGWTGDVAIPTTTELDSAKLELLLLVLVVVVASVRVVEAGEESCSNDDGA
jgi:hypothetical protein